MNESEIIRLADLLNMNNRQIKQVSNKLGRGEAILDCTGYNDAIPDHKLKILFSGIPSEWQRPSELYNFINLDTLESNLSHQINQYILSSDNEQINKPLFWRICFFVISLSILILGAKYVEFLRKPKVGFSYIKIGSMWKPENYASLADYLQNQLIPNDFIKFLKGERVKVIHEGDKTLNYQTAKERIFRKEWDIAFTLSPVLSITAKDSGYTFVANMFPDQPTYYRSAIYVRADSQIQSLSDLKPTTVIAMGDFNSVSSFYVPVYDLYGKSLTVKMGFRGQEIRELIEKGKADVGVGAYGDTIQNNSNIRIIHLSKVIPGSGVYLSPNLPIPDRATLKKVLLHAPKEVNKKANYDLNKEVNYQSLIGIIQKTEKVLECADFTKNPVNFFCHFNKSFSKPVQPINITASVNGFSYINSNMIKLTLEDEKSKIYTLVTFVNLLNQASNGMSVINLQKKQIQIIGAVPKRRADESFEVIITRPNQVKVLN
ncbi:MAG: phosphate/phosphite/phosphonate ABC transporter substrate-binding protein [Pelatocladus maniniholoensis HA4357-MV3]|jgi:ABC-type phosphate/phosphonate transport system substrate-binding protein|uniref:Phosphate/phosphite/phosphonate ABC transporter substrate-binding protein n=1 Tax=Pelatocladus maniniholoensis HA4357-MV3 TaxID=1117104 RepID=A0A9E3LUX3_9NOST|nr:phosphate/phosphite/phosphonate ABC transporter substrate-binding protein [Pelatocladus maniniholoensis HA4357-MV3]